MSQNYDVFEDNRETEEEYRARMNRLRVAEIARRFAEIDRQRIRPLSATALGTATKEDTDKLAELEAQAVTLRNELSGLELH